MSENRDEQLRAEIQKQVDQMAKELCLLDNSIQETNWNTQKSRREE